MAEREQVRVGWWQGRPIDAAAKTVTVYKVACPESACDWRSSFHTRVLPDLHNDLWGHLRAAHGAERADA